MALVALLAGCASQDALPDRYAGQGFHEERLAFESLLSSKGIALGDFTIETFRQTTVENHQQTIQAQLRHNDGQLWHASCLIKYPRPQENIGAACHVHQKDKDRRITLALVGQESKPLSGHMIGDIEMVVEGVDTWIANHEARTPVLAFWEQEQLLGVWTRTNPMSMDIGQLRYDPKATEHQKRSMVLASLLHFVIGDPRDDGASGASADAYLLRPRSTLTDASPQSQALAAHAQRLKVLGAATTSVELVHELDTFDRQFEVDEEAGPVVYHSPVRGPTIEVQVGPAVVADQEGGLSGGLPNAVQFHVGGGVRLYDHTTLQFMMGMQLPAFDLSEVEEQAGQPGTYDSAQLTLGLLGRYTFAPVGGLEPTVGLSVRTKLAFAEYNHPQDTTDDDLGTVQTTLLGFGLAPTIGAQRVLAGNEYNSRIVFF
ncbi:MAG: hypothetical protein AAFS10_28200, partial [Myxococcota bacterium]